MLNEQISHYGWFSVSHLWKIVEDKRGVTDYSRKGRGWRFQITAVILMSIPVQIREYIFEVMVCNPLEKELVNTEPASPLQEQLILDSNQIPFYRIIRQVTQRSTENHCVPSRYLNFGKTFLNEVLILSK